MVEDDPPPLHSIGALDLGMCKGRIILGGVRRGFMTFWGETVVKLKFPLIILVELIVLVSK